MTEGVPKVFDLGRRTLAYGVNDLGQVVGVSGGLGFMATDDLHSFSRIAFPGADTTEIMAINNRGQMVGTFFKCCPNIGGCCQILPHSFLLSGGIFSSIDVPQAIGTSVYGINNNGAIVGSYFDMVGTHGFLLDGGNYLIFDIPNSTGTEAYGINDNGQIVGSYTRSASGLFGYEVVGFLTTADELAAPEPETILLTISGLLVVAAFCRRMTLTLFVRAKGWVSPVRTHNDSPVYSTKVLDWNVRASFTKFTATL